MMRGRPKVRGRDKAPSLKTGKWKRDKQWKEQMSTLGHAREERQRQSNESKIIQAFLKQQKALSYTQLEKESGLTHRPFDTTLKRLREKGIITKIKGKGKRELYWLKIVPNTLVFQVLATSFLHQSLVNNSNDSIDLFNQHLGSLIAYTLKQSNLPQAMSIISPILSQIWAYINPPEKFMGEAVLAPKVESAEWKLWREMEKTKPQKYALSQA